MNNLFFKKTVFTNDNEKIPIGNIYCVGRNYINHIKELKSKNLGVPVIFSKYDNSVIQGNSEIIYPSFTNNLHHEIELIVVIGKKGKNISESEANKFIFGAAVGLDLTLRDVQNIAKKRGTPWLICKAFDNSFPLSKIYKISDLDFLHNIELVLEINGKIVQKGNTKNMIFKIPFLISYISKYFTLNYGDMIMTGTPEGVGPLFKGDKIVFWGSFTEKVKVKII